MLRLLQCALVFSFSLLACGGHDGGGGGSPQAAVDSGRAGVDASTEAGIPSETGAPQGSVRFKLISYNVQARPVLDDPRAAVNLPIIGGRLAGYDIGGVEECFSQCDK